MVLSRPPDPAQGHVGFYIGETPANLLLLGGNQHNAVSVAPFPKSRVIGLRWPATHTPLAQSAPPATPVSPAVFAAALAHVLEMEGGYTDDPADPGGPTNLGITLADYARNRGEPATGAARAQLIDELKALSPEVARAIYFDTYWTPSGCPQFPGPLAFFHFDTAVNMGTGTAINMLQSALGCTIDGEIGPVTIAAATTADPAVLLPRYAGLRRRRYRTLSTFARFGRGWLARVDQTLSRSLALLSSPSPGHPAMPTDPLPAAPSTAPPADPKWWGQYLTIWGAVVTGLAAVLPALGPAIGVSISADTVHTGAAQMAAIIQAALGLAGTIAVIRGRVRATQPLQQRLVSVKI